MKDPHPCIVCGSENISELTISGPDTPSDGDQYTATGGVEPYTWSITKGSITQDGIVTISGQCSGPATITVTDSCGVTKEKGITISAPEITIAGPDAPVNGSCYAAGGGNGPYTWSISKGSIDTNGCVWNISNQCGAATITVTDDCGATATKEVRMPGGNWVTILDTCPWGVFSCKVTSGGTRVRTCYVACGTTKPWGSPCCGGGSCGCDGYGASKPTCDGEKSFYFDYYANTCGAIIDSYGSTRCCKIDGQTVWEWRCQ